MNGNDKEILKYIEMVEMLITTIKNKLNDNKDINPKKLPSDERVNDWKWPDYGDIKDNPYVDGHRKTKCSKCGMEFSGVIGYVCPDMGCPIFPNVSC